MVSYFEYSFETGKSHVYTFDSVCPFQATVETQETNNVMFPQRDLH